VSDIWLYEDWHWMWKSALDICTDATGELVECDACRADRMGETEARR
jgi:hypothetical protein